MDKAEDTVLSVISKILKIDKKSLTKDTKLKSLNYDSMTLLEILSDIEYELGIKLYYGNDYHTIEDVINSVLIAEKINNDS